MKRALSIGLAVVCTFVSTAHGAASAPAKSESYPTRPIRVVIAQSPGSSIDTMSRVVFSKMSELIGQQLVIDNRTGAGGTIGGGIAAHAEPDGYTLFAAATASQVIGPQIYKKVTTYDPFRDFQPISQFAITQNVIVVTPSTPFNSLKDLVAYAKANPGKLRWSNAGTGFQSHLAGVLFTHMAGIDVLHVPYKGAGPSLNAVMSGEAQVSFVPAPSVMGHVRAGRLRGLAVGGEKRAEAAPELPTVIEAGVPGFVSSGWAGLMAPSKVPKRVIDKVRATLHAAINDAATNAALKKVGAEPVVGSAADFAALIRKDWKSFGEAIRVANLKAN
jgi:tripartite-type tricarboxylate transporter receptor subunit TctC